MLIYFIKKKRFFIFIIFTLCSFLSPLYANYDKAIKLYNLKQYKKSVIAFKNFILSDNPNETKKKDAMYNLAVIYDFGLGAPKDKVRAFEWYTKASKLNHKIAQFNLAWIYYNGDNVEKNNFEAFKYYSLSAKQGYSKAQFNLASLYYSGEGTMKDYVNAYKWFKISSLNGIVESQKFINKIKKIIHPDELIAANNLINKWLKDYKNNN